MFIVYCVCQTEPIHCTGGSGLTKGTACNKDLRSQKLQSEARPDVSGECLQRSRDIFIIARDFLDTAV